MFHSFQSRGCDSVVLGGGGEGGQWFEDDKGCIRNLLTKTLVSSPRRRITHALAQGVPDGHEAATHARGMAKYLEQRERGMRGSVH